jgi:hypothetical protein
MKNFSLRLIVFQRIDYLGEAWNLDVCMESSAVDSDDYGLFPDPTIFSSWIPYPNPGS